MRVTPYVGVHPGGSKETGGRTKVIIRSVFETVEDRDGTIDAGMEEGVFESMDRLAGLPAKMKAERKAA